MIGAGSFEAVFIRAGVHFVFAAMFSMWSKLTHGSSGKRPASVSSINAQLMDIPLKYLSIIKDKTFLRSFIPIFNFHLDKNDCFN